MSHFKHLVTVAALVAAICGGIYLLNYIYVDGSINLWERVAFHDFYSKKGFIENIFVGSSHVYQDIDPQIIEQYGINNCFNLSTSSQSLHDSYYLIKEAIRDNDIKNVYLEIPYDITTGEDGKYKDSENIHRAWRCLDYMKPSLNKMAFLLTMSEPDKYLDSAVAFVRYKDYIFDADYIRDNIAYKSNDKYKNYVFDEVDGRGREIYTDDNFMITDVVLEEEKMFRPFDRDFEEAKVSDDARYYYDKIVKLCNKKNLHLVTFIAPMTEYFCNALLNYDSFSKEVREMAESHDVMFYDFNYIKPEYMNLDKAEYFCDVEHLNQEGSKLFSPVLAECMTTGKDISYKFFESLEEKYRAIPGRVLGMSYVDGDDDMRDATIVTTRGAEFEYEIYIGDYGLDNDEVIQEFDENDEFSFDRDGDLKITINYKDEYAIINTLILHY